MTSVTEGLDRAQRILPMSAGIVVELHRPDGAPAAMRLVDEAAQLRNAGLPILGIGSDGDHRGYPLSSLSNAYRAAHDAGFRLTGHIMSHQDAATALELGFTRFDHGWVIANDPALMRDVADAGVSMTFTPMAYALGGHDSHVPWPVAFRRLQDAGIPLVIGTDDPALHHTDIAHSYELVAHRVGWGAQELAAGARASFSASWAPSHVRPTLSENIAEIDALLANPKAPDRKTPRSH